MVPVLRFKGFHGKWETLTLNDISISTDGDWIESKHIFPNGNYRIIQTGNIGVGRFINDKSNAKYITNKGFNELKATRIYPNEILICRLASPVGRAILAPNLHTKMVTAVDVAIIKNNKNTDKCFLVEMFNTSLMMNKSDRWANGTTRKRISRKNLLKIPFEIPSLSEQRLIGRFFAKLDKLISLQQAKCYLLKKLRMGYLQKIFNRKLVFNALSKWKIIKLGDITNWKRGKKLAKSKLNTIGKGNPVVHYADLYKFSAIQNRVIHWSTSSEGVLIPNNSLLFPMSDVTPDGLATTTNLIQHNVKASGDTLIATVNDENNAGFLSYEINANPHKILRLVVGTTVRHVHAKDLASIKLIVPLLPEQHKIAKFFKSLDNDITCHTRKIYYLRKLKEAYLQKMFC